MQDEFRDVFNQAQSEGPINRAQAKLMKYKDAMQLALVLLKSEPTNNIDPLCDPSDHCTECESKDNYFKNQHMLQAQWS